jgi:regulator of protease activity HflC (stomatin/prohibitin superfamily)
MIAVLGGHVDDVPSSPMQRPVTDAAEPRKGSGAGCLACVAGLAVCPLTFLSSYFCLKPQESVVILRCGEYERTVSEPGLHWSNCCGREMMRISLKLVSLELPRTAVADASGCPLVVSAIVVYRIVDSRRALLDIEDPFSFVRAHSEAVLRAVVSRFPYDAPTAPGTGGAPPATGSLRAESTVVAEQMAGLLQQRVAVAGVEVCSFVIKEITYAPEIASAMLRRQQAAALLEARQTIVRGAVDIATNAVSQLSARGMEMPDTERARIVSNLLTVICGEHDPHPTITM